MVFSNLHLIITFLCFVKAKSECRLVQKAWLQGVVPAVMDSESSVQDKALEVLDQVLLSQIKLYSPGRHLDSSQQLTWDLLGLLCHECQNLRSEIQTILCCNQKYCYLKKEKYRSKSQTVWRHFFQNVYLLQE